MKDDPVLQDRLDQKTLSQLASAHTKRPTIARYRDNNVTKEYFRIARRTRTAYTWKRALRSRQEGYKAWREQRVAEAMEGNWQALRQRRPPTNSGWESELAENLHPQDLHEALHSHYEGIFGTGDEIIQRSVNPPASPDITEDELVFALQRGRKQRSVGHDMTE